MDLNSITDKFIFVVGNSRSGTTMMGHMLGQSPDVFMFRELHFFEGLYEPDTLDKPISDSEATDLITQLILRQRTNYAIYRPSDEKATFTLECCNILDSLIRSLTPLGTFIAYLRYETQRNGRSFPLDQTPRNVFHLQTVLSHFPNAYVINMVRDARDVILSQKYKWQRFWKEPNIPNYLPYLFWANYHPITMSFIWNTAIEAGLSFQEHPRMGIVRFEDVIRQPDKQLNSICDFLEINFSPDMMQIPSNSSHDLLDQRLGIDKSSRKRWKRDTDNRRDLAICQRLTSAGLLYLNYEISPNLSLTIIDRVIAVLTWPFESRISL